MDDQKWQKHTYNPQWTKITFSLLTQSYTFWNKNQIYKNI